MDFIFLTVIGILLYLVTLLLLRIRLFKSRLKSESYSNCCPVCSLALDRIRSKKSDNLTNTLTLNIFRFKRFICRSCKWKGLLAKYSKKI